MSSYILKNESKKQNVLLYQEVDGYSFTPKKSYKAIKRITILDSDIKKAIWNAKISKEYNRLVKLIYALISSEDATSGDVLVVYTEIDRIRNYLKSLEEKRISKELIERYQKKLYVLELELKKVHVMELTEEINEEKGRGR